MDETTIHDLAIIIVSNNGAHWIRRVLPTIFAHTGNIRADVIVVDNSALGDAAKVVQDEFPDARALVAANHGFGHANNRGLMTCNARYVLFLNPDTEILEGSLAELVALMDRRPTVGLVGCRQVTPDGRVDTTIRYFPNALRALGDAVSAERLSKKRPRWLGEREIDPRAYEREFGCDWTSGSFMLARRETLESAGYFDERYFMYSEEIDLCRRIKLAGWEVRHLPQMTILHHDKKDGVTPDLEMLMGVARLMYARKHFSLAHRWLYAGALMLRHALRTGYAGSGELGRQKRQANREVTAAMLGRRTIPFAAITSPVAVQTADAELRDISSPASRLAGVGESAS